MLVMANPSFGLCGQACGAFTQQSFIPYLSYMNVTSSYQVTVGLSYQQSDEYSICRDEEAMTIAYAFWTKAEKQGI